MNQTRLLKKLDGFRKRNSTNPKFINKDLYRLLYDEDIYIIAYNAIKSNHGAETKGADGTSLTALNLRLNLQYPLNFNRKRSVKKA